MIRLFDTIHSERGISSAQTRIPHEFHATKMERELLVFSRLRGDAYGD